MTHSGPAPTTASMPRRLRLPNRHSLTHMALLLSIVSCAPAGLSIDTSTGPMGAAATVTDITEEDLERRLSVIAADSMEGRFTGSIGHVKVTDYLASELSRLGLQPAGEHGGYFQPVPMVRRVLVSQAIGVGTERMDTFSDIVAIHPGGRLRSFEGARVIFGGVMEDAERQITAEQAAGKLVILIYGNQRNTGGNIKTGQYSPNLATAAAIATVNPPPALGSWANASRTPRPVFVGDEVPNADWPAAMAISQRAADLLLGQRADSTVPLGTPGKVASGRVVFRTESLTVRNVIAILPGADPGLAGEYVALGAHSDHIPPRWLAADHDSLRQFNLLALRREEALGVASLNATQRAEIRVDVDSLAAIRPPRADSINNGADDDGSGTVALLEIAEAMARGEGRPARSVLFVWHAAEEMGMVGSKYFTSHPTVDRDRIVAQINLDMIGRGGSADLPEGGPDYLEVVGWRRISGELGDVVDRVNRQSAHPFAFDERFDAAGHPERIYCRSDHYSYARFGIPVAFLTTGQHADYHQVTDEPQYIDYVKLAKVARFVRRVTAALGDLGHRLRIDVPAGDPDADCVQ